MLENAPRIHDARYYLLRRIAFFTGLTSALLSGYLLVSVFAPNFKDHAEYKISTYSTPQSLQGMALLAKTPTGEVGLYTWNKTQFTPQTFDQEVIKEASVQGTNTVFITTTPRGEYEIRDTHTKLYTSRAVKKDIALSPNGNTIVFSELIGTSSQLVTSWSIKVLDRGSGKIETVSSGVSPHFLDDKTLIMLTAQAVMKTSLDTKQQQPLLDYISESAFTVLELSPNKHVFLLKEKSKSNIGIYRLLSEDTFQVSGIAAYTLSAASSFVLTDDYVYSLKQESDHTSFLKYDFTAKEETKEYDFFKQFRPLVLILKYE